MMWKKVNGTKYKCKDNDNVLAILFVERMQKGKNILLQRVILSIEIENDNETVIAEKVIARLPVDEEHEISKEHLKLATKSLIEYHDKLIVLLNCRRKRLCDFILE